MSPTLLFSFVIGYFLVLLAVAWFTSKGSNNESFFIGNRKSNWMLVAFGMIGTSLSGVTFVSVPGGVGTGNFYYFQIVIGYLFGYITIAFVLLPLFYRMNLTSIYTYLEKRFGINAHKAGASFFILSRSVGATARLYLVINILQIFILDKLGIPFIVTTLVILFMILLYTFEGGVKTIIYTDTLQTSGMLIGLVVCIIVIIKALGTDFSGALNLMSDKGYTQIFNTDIKAGSYFMKHIIGGMFIAIAMTGLDQEMMQKNISVKRLGDSQKNVITLAIMRKPVSLVPLRYPLNMKFNITMNWLKATILINAAAFNATSISLGLKNSAIFSALKKTPIPSMTEHERAVPATRTATCHNILFSPAPMSFPISDDMVNMNASPGIYDMLKTCPAT